MATTVHYWYADYISNVLNETNKIWITSSYLLVCIAGPLGGVLFSFIANKFVGGYESKNSVFILVGFQIITTAFALCVPFAQTKYQFVCFVLGYIIFNNCASPMIQGICLSLVRTQLKGLTITIVNLTTPLITSGPLPKIYGMLNDYFKVEGKLNYAMLCIMLIEILGIILGLILAFIRREKIRRENKGDRQTEFDISMKKSKISHSINENDQ